MSVVFEVVVLGFSGFPLAKYNNLTFPLLKRRKENFHWN